MTFPARISVVLAFALALAAPAAAVIVFDGGPEDSGPENSGPENSGVQRHSAPASGRLYRLRVDVAATAADPVNQPLDSAGSSAMPEATTWALLTTGFASVGLLARRRRARRPMVAA